MLDLVHWTDLLCTGCALCMLACVEDWTKSAGSLDWIEEILLSMVKKRKKVWWAYMSITLVTVWPVKIILQDPRPCLIVEEAPTIAIKKNELSFARRYYVVNPSSTKSVTKRSYAEVAALQALTVERKKFGAKTASATRENTVDEKKKKYRPPVSLTPGSTSNRLRAKAINKSKVVLVRMYFNTLFKDPYTHH